jgi:outer membrane translocation and assembly module TamA
VRKVFFIDVGEAVANLSDIDLENLNIGIGAGLRWKMRRFVNFNLRIDFAYGLETDKFRIAAGAKHRF